MRYSSIEGEMVARRLLGRYRRQGLQVPDLLACLGRYGHLGDKAVGTGTACKHQDGTEGVRNLQAQAHHRHAWRMHVHAM